MERVESISGGLFVLNHFNQSLLAARGGVKRCSFKELCSLHKSDAPLVA
jgi:hypothetical protein